MKKIIIFSLVFLFGIGLLLSSGCSGKKNSKAHKTRIALVLSVGGLGDKSFNDMAYKGLMNAKERFNVSVAYAQPKQMAEDEKFLRKYAESGFDLTIAVGFLMRDAVMKVAKEFPNSSFAIIDAVDTEDSNVASLVFREQEGSFLVGAIAGLMTKTNKVGFIGGMDIPLIHKFQLGYTEGVKYVNPKCDIISTYVGSGPSAFHDPFTGKQLALSTYSKGADIIFHAAGSSGNGVIEAAAEKKLFAIGVDADQNYMKPGYVLTSMVKRVDVAVYNIIKKVTTNQFKGGLYSFGLAEDGVDYALDQYNKDLIPQSVIYEVNQLKNDIITGKIKVSDYTKLH